MFTTIYNFMVTQNFWFYTIFVILCLLHSVILTFKEAFDLNKERKKAIANNEYFSGSLTVGNIFWALVYPFIPFLNIVAFIFMICPDVIGKTLDKIRDIFNYNIFPSVTPKKVEEK